MRPLFFGVQEYRTRLPTTDLYFLNPLRHALRRKQGAALPRVEWLAPNVYAVGATGIISRYGSQRDLDRLSAHGVRRIVYIADDDFEAGAADPNLPAAYRARLAAFAQEAWPALREAADVVVVPSPVLAAAYVGKARIIHPAWHHEPAGTRHFDRPRRIEIAHLGTGSHRADIAPLAAVLTDLLNANKNVRLTLAAGAETAAELKDQPQVRVRRPAPWWRYKHMLPWRRFHLAIYPLQPTPFNRARSANKLFEQALLGAAPLMSPIPALREAAGADLVDVFVEGGPEQWAARLEGDILDIAAATRRAERAASRIRSLDPLGAAARQWLAILGTDT
jgi:hypothetical protein